MLTEEDESAAVALLRKLDREVCVSLGFSLSLICGLGRRMRRLLLRCCGDMIAGFVSEVSGFSLGLVWV